MVSFTRSVAADGDASASVFISVVFQRYFKADLVQPRPEGRGISQLDSVFFLGPIAKTAGPTTKKADSVLHTIRAEEFVSTSLD